MSNRTDRKSCSVITFSIIIIVISIIMIIMSSSMVIIITIMSMSRSVIVSMIIIIIMIITDGKRHCTGRTARTRGLCRIRARQSEGCGIK